MSVCISAAVCLVSVCINAAGCFVSCKRGVCETIHSGVLWYSRGTVSGALCAVGVNGNSAHVSVRTPACGRTFQVRPSPLVYVQHSPASSTSDNGPVFGLLPGSVWWGTHHRVMDYKLVCCCRTSAPIQISLKLWLMKSEWFVLRDWFLVSVYDLHIPQCLVYNILNVCGLWMNS